MSDSVVENEARRLTYESSSYIWKDTINAEVKPDFSGTYPAKAKALADNWGLPVLNYSEWRGSAGWSIMVEVEVESLTPEQKDDFRNLIGHL